MFPFLKRGFLALVAGCVLLGVQSNGLAEDLLISFEEEEGYKSGVLDRQQEWQVYGGNVNQAKIVPVSGAPGGHASVKVTQGTGHLNKTLGKPLSGTVIFSGRTRLDPEGEASPFSRFFISNSESNRRYGGVSFGIEEQDGKPVLFYRDGDSKLPLAPDHVVSPATFYRFEAKLNTDQATYDIAVYEEDQTEPLGKAEGASFRGGTRALDHLMLNGTPGAYFDEIRIIEAD